MNLILEIVSAPNVEIFQKRTSFDRKGGKIGRSKSAKWTLNDPSKQISNYHAEISYNNGHYYVTDISTNGMYLENPRRQLTKGSPVQLTEKTVFCIGNYIIGVKTIEEDFASQKPLQEKESRQHTIADDFFVGNDSESAFGVINSSSPEENDIVSILDNSFADDSIPNDPIGSYEIDSFLNIEEGIVGEAEDSLLHAQVDTPTFQEDTGSKASEELNHKYSLEKEYDSPFKILAMKIGIDTNVMSRNEQEKLATIIGDLLVTTIDHLLETSRIVSGIVDDMGLSGTNSAQHNTFKQSKTPYDVFSVLQAGSHTLIYEIKESFKEIDKHNIAYYETIKEIPTVQKDRFSPKKLYRTFEDDGLLEKSFINKKALAWEAYCHKFKYLDGSESEKIEFEEIKKVYTKRIESLNLGYNK